MTSSRLILIFLAFIFLIIILLSSNRIASTLRAKFSKFIPSLSPITDNITPTPTIIEETPTPTLTPTPTIVYGNTNKRPNNSTKNIPATGPADLAWLILGGSFLSGITLKKIFGKKS